METEFKPGDLVVNQANPNKIYTLIEIMPESGNTKCYDADNEMHMIPLMALKMYESPKKPTIKDATNRW